MVFSSTIFTFLFLPSVLGLYFIARDNYKNYILLGASLLFYSYGEPRFVLIMVASIIVNYLFARGIDFYQGPSQRRILLAMAVMCNIGILYVFKYLDFSITILNGLLRTDLKVLGIRLPIGISFFTFQALSYVIDVYRRKVTVQKNPFYLALYISFFPQLVAGPIVRYITIAEQIEHRKTTFYDFGEGARRFMLGFCKKILLANNLAAAAARTFSITDLAASNPGYLWLGSICYSLQIYYDFSGYSDMAIGIGKMFGFHFEENFNYPYISKSVTEFWRRWHISLGQWFRDYIYFPLGGSRVNPGRHIFNLFVVWMLTGLWHGANYTFVAWGGGIFSPSV